MQDFPQVSHVEDAEAAFPDRVKGPGPATVNQGARFVHLHCGAYC